MISVAYLTSGTYAPIDADMELLAKIFEQDNPLDVTNTDRLWLESLPLVTARVLPVPDFPTNKYNLMLCYWQGDGKQVNMAEYSEELAFLLILKRPKDLLLYISLPVFQG